MRGPVDPTGGRAARFHEGGRCIRSTGSGVSQGPAGNNVGRRQSWGPPDAVSFARTITRRNKERFLPGPRLVLTAEREHGESCCGRRRQKFGVCDLHLRVYGQAKGCAQCPRRHCEPPVVDARDVQIDRQGPGSPENSFQLRCVGMGVLLAVVDRGHTGCGATGGTSRSGIPGEYHRRTGDHHASLRSFHAQHLPGDSGTGALR